MTEFSFRIRRHVIDGWLERAYESRQRQSKCYYVFIEITMSEKERVTNIKNIFIWFTNQSTKNEKNFWKKSEEKKHKRTTQTTEKKLGRKIIELVKMFLHIEINSKILIPKVSLIQ